MFGKEGENEMLKIVAGSFAFLHSCDDKKDFLNIFSFTNADGRMPFMYSPAGPNFSIGMNVQTNLSVWRRVVRT